MANDSIPDSRIPVNSLIGIQPGDIVEVTDDAIGEPRLSWVIGDRQGEHYFTPGERAKVLAVQYDHDEPWLIYVRFPDGSEDNMFAGWLEVVDRPTPNDPTKYECDLFTFANVGVDNG